MPGIAQAKGSLGVSCWDDSPANWGIPDKASLSTGAFSEKSSLAKSSHTRYGLIEDFLSNIGDPTQREDSRVLIEIMGQVSGQQPVVWGARIIGFGKLRYKYASGREGEWMKIGFSPRKDNLTLYLMCDTAKIAPELAIIGKHKTGKGCIYIKKLTDVNIDNLASLISKAYSEAKDA